MLYACHIDENSVILTLFSSPLFDLDGAFSARPRCPAPCRNCKKTINAYQLQTCDTKLYQMSYIPHFSPLADIYWRQEPENLVQHLQTAERSASSSRWVFRPHETLDLIIHIHMLKHTCTWLFS